MVDILTAALLQTSGRPRISLARQTIALSALQCKEQRMEIAKYIQSSGSGREVLPPAPDDDYKPRLAVFGTSADPPHNGHMMVVQMLVDSAQYDEVWVLPVFVHMFSSKDKSLSPFDQRMEMCRLAFEHYSTTNCSVKVLPIEKLACEGATAVNDGEPVRVGSSLILDIIHLLYPGTSGLTTFVLGSDTFIDLIKGKWRHAASILLENGIAVVERGLIRNGEGDTTDLNVMETDDPISSAIANCTVIKPSELRVSRFASKGHLMVSSSKVRALVAKMFDAQVKNAIDQAGSENPEIESCMDELRSMLLSKVLDYIIEEGLYTLKPGQEYAEI